MTLQKKDEAIKIYKECELVFGWRPAAITNSSAAAGQNVVELLGKRPPVNCIVTFCKELDELLGGGIPLGEVTEICGVPGVGKTQLGMQLALDVQIPSELGGVEASALYIDTEGSLMPTRLEQMAGALQRHITGLVKKRCSTDAGLQTKVADTWTLSSLLDRVHVVRCTTLADQLSAVRCLDSFLDSLPTVRLVVLDSVAFHFRYYDPSDNVTRSRDLHSLSQSLHMVASRRGVAVLVINQVTSASTSGAASGMASCDGSTNGYGSGSRLVPALGEAWAHACTSRIVLEWSPTGCRIARLVKSPSRAPGVAAYAVVPDGVRTLKTVKILPQRQPPPIHSSTGPIQSEALAGAGLAGKKRPGSSGE